MQIETGHLELKDRLHWEAFQQAYPDDEHLRLACHAAFPVALTSDLLYKIWLNFRPSDTTNDPLENLATVSDILHSPLCREIGRDIYEMHPDLRTVLLESLQADPAFGDVRILELARFLRDYLRHNPGKIPTPSFREAQNWVTESYLEPEKAAQTILALLEQEGQDPNAANKVDFYLSWAKQRNHLQRAAIIDNAGADVLLATEEIVQGFRQYRAGDMKGAMEKFRSLEPFIGAADGNGKGFKARIPGEVWEAMNKPIAPQGKAKSLALELIEKEKREKTGILDLGNCGLREVPEEVFELEWLEVLSFSHEYSCWNVEEKYFDCLATINQGKPNHLETLPLKLGILSNLKALAIAGDYDNKWELNDLSALSGLSNLQSLTVYHTQVSDLTALSGLANLQRLAASQTSVNDLTPLQGLLKLQLLYVHQTNVIDLMPLSGLTNLQELDISQTQVRDLMPIFPLLEKKLHHINVIGSRLQNPPIEIANEGREAILNYFTHLETEQKNEDYLFEANLFIIGEAGAGKTSLCQKLMNPGSSVPNEAETTLGINIHAMYFPMKDGKQFRINLWEFGGQEIYHATHQFFLTTRSLYLLVDDTRKDDKSVSNPTFRYWLQTAELMGEGSPLLIVQNEKSDRRKDIDLLNIQERFNFVTGTLSVNLATNRGLGELRAEIEHLVQTLPHIGTPMPLKWIRVREAIDELAKRKAFISREEWFELCNSYQVEAEVSSDLSKFLHDLGVIFHFQEDSFLSRIIIIQKYWIAKATYLLLDDEKIINKNQGRFTENDLQRVWSQSDYHSQTAHLLAFLEKLDFCYQIPNAQPLQWIVPQLLPYSKPKYDWQLSGNLSLRYRYDFMPEGLFSRFVVRLHQFIINPDLVWRHGVLLERLGVRAEVIEGARESNSISIRVEGGNMSQRKELLLLIIDDFDKLHRTYNSLRVEKLIPCNCKICVNSIQPYYYEYDKLIVRKQKGKHSVECGHSLEDVPIRKLLFIPFDYQKALERLNELIGLDSVKQQIKKQIILLQASEQHPDRSAMKRLNLVFKGNPGTGKATIARLVGEIYQEAGVLERGHLVEVDRSRLVSEYVGHTTTKTEQLCEEAMGGVLFIKDAYALKENESDVFGQEAIDTLLNMMENNRDKLCVIFAGYQKQIEAFLRSNPGLERRIASSIDFQDYKLEELVRIFELNENKKHLKLTEEAKKSTSNILRNLYYSRDENFGNAGEVEKLIQGMIDKHALRCAEKSLNLGDTPVGIEDIPAIYLPFAGLGNPEMEIKEVILGTSHISNWLILGQKIDS